jgi:general secretion pathway protein D
VKRSKIVLWIGGLAVAAIAVWWAGLRDPASYLPLAEQKAAAESSRVRGGPAGPNESGVSEPDQPAEDGPSDANEGTPEPNTVDSNQPSEPEPVGDPNDPLEAINLKNVEMKNIVEKIAQWTGKTVIPHDDALKQKITIYAPAKLPRSKALARIYSALRLKDFIIEEVDDTIFIKPIAKVRLGTVPTVGADQPLAAFENRDQVVQKFFKLSNYSPGYMVGLIQPLVGEYGFVSADESTRSLLVIDTVSNLMRIEQIIQQFDVPEAEQAVTRIFEIQYGDPAEIVQLLRILLGVTETRGSSSGRSSRDRDRYGPYGSPARPPEGRPGGQPRPTDAKAGTAASYVIGRAQGPLILIPDVRRRWIIARASPEDIQQIEEWIKKLDTAEPIESEYEVIPLTYADAREVEQSIEDTLRTMPGMELMPSVTIESAQGQILVFGRSDLREMVRKLVAEMDMPVGNFETRDFELQHADAEQIKTNIENLFGEGMDSYSRYGYYYPRYRYGRGDPSQMVKVIAFSTMNKVTVVASPENMKKIAEQIKLWDVPLDVEAVRPRIITLQNSDPVQMSDLLTRLFSEEQDTSRSFIRMIFFGDMGGQRQKIVGPLYGQLTFEDVPGTKKIIVISKIPEAYDVIEQLIYDLDREEMAELPKVVQLQYADPEDLAERLNAMFNEAGTVAPIRRTARGLGDYSMDRSDETPSGSASRNDGGGGSGANAGEYTPPWSRAGGRRGVDEEPISNVIGRVRFIPDPRSKAILMLAPPEFHSSLEETIRELDVPGMQVMIKATVVEVDHRALTSLGVQLATDPEAFGTLEENAILALSALTSLATHGSAAPADTPLGAEGSGTIVGGATNVYFLLDFLIKHTNAKILNEQTLWTEDNEEASFFKGQTVAFQMGTSISETGGRVTSDFEFEDVGMTLAVRPSITPERNVDMIVNVLLSQLTGAFVNGQPVRTAMETKTNMIVHDGDTLMLGGILFQENSKIKRKLPLLGDLPLVGGLFQHNDVALTNNEMIVFITPSVISETIELSEKAKQQIEEANQRLREIREEFGAAAEKLREELEGD